MNYNQNKMKEFLFNSPSYKHVNTYLPAIVSGFDIERYLTSWLEKEENLRFLHCMELINATEKYNQHEYQSIQDELKAHNPIKVEDWCKRTLGKSLVFVNDEVFAIDYVAVKIAFDLGGDETKAFLQKTFDAIYEEDRQYEQYLTINRTYHNLDIIYQRLALHLLAESDRYWISLWYQAENRVYVLNQRANFILQIFTELI